MKELRWLDGYSGQTVDELIALDGKCRTDSIVLAFEQAMDQKADRVGIARLTDEERVILAVEALEREVNNGGYDQFFVNSSREYAPIIVDSLRRLGCTKIARITQKAVEISLKYPISDEDIDDGTWSDNEQRAKAFDDCDARYYEQTENIAEKLLAFIKANRRKIKP